MDNEIQLISDGDGLAVIGNATDVERFLASEDLVSRDIRMKRLKSAFGGMATVAQASSEIAASTSRWVKLTPESAQLLKKYKLMTGSTSDVSRAIVTKNGKIKGILEISKTRSFLTNPAFLSGAAGLMAQLAMQQTMDEITDYLATIDAKVDDILRAQKDAVLADMIGMDFTIQEAMTIQEQVGRVSEVTWSKVQGASMTVARTQAYALRQLDALTEKVEQRTKIGDLAATTKEAESTVREWLAVLAHCFQLQDAIAVLELDRVLNTTPEELDDHRQGLRAARENRLGLISRSTEQLVARMLAAAGTANAKVLMHRSNSPAVVYSSNHVMNGIHDFHALLGIESCRQSSEVKRWTQAATEVKDKAIETGARGVGAARDLGSEARDRAGAVKDKLSSEIAERARRRRGDQQEGDKRS